MVDGLNERSRQSMRLRYFDYSKPGYYFVTICVQQHLCVFGEIVDGCMELNDTGKLVKYLWERLPRRFATVQLDAFVIMPNHVHGIIELTDLPPSENPVENPRVPVRFQATMRFAANRRRIKPVLGAVVRDFKGAAAYEIHKEGFVEFAWQRNYYESIIDDEKSLEVIRNYIVNNPETWAKDKLYKM